MLVVNPSLVPDWKVGEGGMNVGVCKVRLQIPENQSLKGKRRVIASMSQRIRNRFGVAVAEVEDNESWQMATLGIAYVSSSVRHADEVLDTSSPTSSEAGKMWCCSTSNRRRFQDSSEV
ncbi:MAG: DUF503 domain-containing protein [Chloroflexi bacterium]|nr:DUF503 domain-containing protein [Chloroflexota bacterium]